MPGGVVLAEPDRPMCAKLLSADGPAEASSVVCASLRRGLEALAGRRAGRCGGCDSAAQAARQAHSTTALRMLRSSPTIQMKKGGKRRTPSALGKKQELRRAELSFVPPCMRLSCRGEIRVTSDEF